MGNVLSLPCRLLNQVFTVSRMVLPWILYYCVCIHLPPRFFYGFGVTLDDMTRYPVKETKIFDMDHDLR
jgi:hypothetical protein